MARPAAQPSHTRRYTPLSSWVMSRSTGALACPSRRQAEGGMRTPSRSWLGGAPVHGSSDVALIGSCQGAPVPSGRQHLVQATKAWPLHAVAYATSQEMRVCLCAADARGASKKVGPQPGDYAHKMAASSKHHRECICRPSVLTCIKGMTCKRALQAGRSTTLQQRERLAWDV